MLKTFFRRLEFRSGLREFFEDMPNVNKVLDVGILGDSVLRIKSLAPQVFYVGVDIFPADDLGNQINFIDAYFQADTESFSECIRSIDIDNFDVVVSAHNLEHCHRPFDVLLAMIGKVRLGGRIYISTPCEESINFPSRCGTLNFFDDPTHGFRPIEIDRIISCLENNGFEVVRFVRRHRPWLTFVRGLVNEFRSKRSKKNMPGTWEFWGFETIVWAQRNE